MYKIREIFNSGPKSVVVTFDGDNPTPMRAFEKIYLDTSDEIPIPSDPAHPLKVDTNVNGKIIPNTVHYQLNDPMVDYICINTTGGGHAVHKLSDKIHEVKLTVVQLDGVIIIGTVDIGPIPPQ